METTMEADELERLQTLSKYDIIDTPPEPAFDDLAELAADVCEAPISFISFLDEGREWFKSHFGTPLNELPREAAFSDYTSPNGDVTVVSDLSRDTRFTNNPLVRGEPHIRFYAGCPLISADGHRLGAISVLDNTPHELTPKQRQALRVLGHETMLLLELRRELHEKQRSNEEFAVQLADLRERLANETTEHRRTEENLLKRERQLADAQRIANLGSWEWDLSDNSVTWSDELYRIFGAAPGEFPASYERYLQHVHPEDRPAIKALIEATLKAKGQFFSETRIVRADGKTRTLHTHGEVILDRSGKPLRMIGSCQDKTVSKQTELKLEKSLSLLRATLESTTDGVLIVDSQGQLMSANRKFLELWKLPDDVLSVYEDDRVLEMAMSQLKNPNDFISKVRYLYAHPDENSFDVLHFVDGRTFERYSQPQRIGHEVVGRVWSFRDITERCRALRILQESEERYRSLVIASAPIVWTTDAAGYAVEDCPTWRKFTGQTEEELLGKGWLNALHPKDRGKVAEYWARVLARKEIFEGECRIRRSDGQWRFMRARGVPVFEKNGLLREWIGTFTDITQNKIARQTIMAERDFSNALINSLPGIFYLLDETGLNLRWNKNLENVTGYSASEIKTMRAIDFVPEEEKQPLTERVHKVFETGQADIEINLLTKSGQRLPHYCTGKFLFLKGKPRLIGTGIDISERLRAEAEIKKLNQSLEKRVEERTIQLNSTNQDLQSFTYTVSHDLKAPLRAIKGFAQALDEECKNFLNAEQLNYLERIISSADRMAHLIEDLLGHSRLGRTALDVHPVSLNKEMRNIADEFQRRIDAIGGKISIVEDLPQVSADVTLIGQIFSNLLENAIAYRKPDVPLEIRIFWRKQNNRAVICIGDNGIGIAPQHHQRIFEVFQRLHTDAQHPGTGIGLASVKKAAEILGGKAWVESELGKGSTFCVELNLAEP